MIRLKKSLPLSKGRCDKMTFTCHFCRAEIAAHEPHTICVDYPEVGCGETHFCPKCVNPDDSPEERSNRIRQLFIALVTADDLDGPRILPGSA
jgi:hypothetical protein